MPKSNFEKLVYLLPVLISGGLLSIYLFIPGFYLTYVLSGEGRESQIVENITFLVALFAAVLIWKNAWLLKKTMHLKYRIPMWILVLVGTSVFFLPVRK